MTTPGPVLAYMPDRGIGDLMWHLPTIRAIAAQAPSGRVVLATRPATRAADVLGPEPAVEQVEYLTYHAGPLKTFREIADFYRLCRRLRPASVWIMEKIGRPAQAAFLAGVPDRRGFGLGHASQERWLSPGPTLPKSMRKAHRIEKLAAFEQLNGLSVESREPALKVDPAAVEAILARFADRPRPWVVFGASAADADKCWPIDRFVRLADELAGRVGTIFWTGAPNEAEMFSRALEAAAAPEVSVVACDKLDEAAALLSQAQMFVGNDSGPMNLAAAVGTPAVGLFGRTPPLTYSQWLQPVASPTSVLADLEVGTVVQAIDEVRAAGGLS